MVVSSETVSSNTIKNFEAWNSVTIGSSTIDGTSNIHARQEINVNSEFHASNTSEVHIYTDEIFPDCSDFNGYLHRMNHYGNNDHNNDSSATGQIEIYFQKPSGKNTLSVIPNPSGGHFLVRLNSSDTESFILHITIYDMIGKEVYSSKENKQSVNIDLSNYPKGIYFLKANDATITYNQKVILH